MLFLVVEDDEASRRLLVHHLSKHGDCDSVEDGAEAIRAVTRSLLEKKPYDAIFLDIMMPNLDGMAALKKIRSLEDKSGLGQGMGARIVMTTALSDEDNIMDAMADQCDAYIVKPIEKEKLTYTLSRLKLINKGAE